MDSIGDEDDINPGNGICDTQAGGGPCTLRAAIRESNALANSPAGVPDEIHFNISGSGVHTIRPATVLPTIVQQLVIDGLTQPGAVPNSAAVGFNGTLLVELSGQLAGSVSGLTLGSGSANSVVRGLVVNRFGSNGIVLGSMESMLEGSLIGTDSTGTIDFGNGGSGVVVTNGASARVGGPLPAQRNVISGNTRYGVNLENAGNAIVVNNYIGTNGVGTAALGNGDDGIIINASNGNRIGGTTAAERNVISGNGADGSGSGIALFNTGGFFFSVCCNAILGNFIGTDVTGSAAIPNRGNGISLGPDNANSNRIGGSAAGSGNLISGNLGSGIALSGNGGGGADQNNTVIQGNRIGVQADGASPLGNRDHGINLGGESAGTRIGGLLTSESNIIAFNGGAGITKFFTFSDAGYLGNSIYSNAGLGIDIGSPGITPNDDGDGDTGTNRLQNFPEIHELAIGSGMVTAQYVVRSSTAHSAYPLRVEFFKADAAGQEGQTWIGFDTYTSADAGSLKTAVFAPAAVLAPADRVVATATDANGNTSEFSVNSTVQRAACSFEVTTTVDVVWPVDGMNSLREAILCANETPGDDTITLPGGTYTLAIAGRDEDAGLTGDLDVTGGLTVSGAGSMNTVIDGAGLDRVFDIRTTRIVAITGMTIRGGSTGANPSDHGGGIRFDNLNGTEQGASLILDELLITHNSSQASGGGVAFLGPGVLSIAYSAITENTAGGHAGGILIAHDECFVQSSCLAQQGYLDVGIAHTEVLRNTAGGKGGGIHISCAACAHASAAVNIDQTTVAQNRAGTQSGNGDGGGIYASLFGPALTLVQSSIVENVAAGSGGGFSSRGTLAVINSTVSTNSASLAGGGIHFESGDLRLTNVTVTANQAPDGGGVFENSDSVAVTNSIIATNTDADCAGNGIGGASHFNIDSDGTCDWSGNGNRTADPMLGPLADNGGPTRSHAISMQSPAINAGDDAVLGGPLALSTDQRGEGFPRRFGPHVDIGAFELQTAPPIRAVDDVVSTDEDTPVSVAILDNDDDNGRGPLVIVSVTQPAHGTAEIIGERILYSPRAGFHGSDSFTYQVRGNDPATDEGLVTVHVHAVDDAPPPLQVLSGQKFNDSNGNGRRDPGEVGLDEIGIQLIDTTTGDGIGYQYTHAIDLDADGHIDPERERGWYSFDNLPPGEYLVYEDVPYGRIQTFPHGEVTRISDNDANSHSFRPSLGGLYVAFLSHASNLVESDTNGVADVFVFDQLSSSKRRVSVNTAGGQANGASYEPVINAHGQVVVFRSVATNLVGDDHNGVDDIFAHDLATGVTRRVSVHLGGGEANGASHNPTVSYDGRFVAFESVATNLVPNDTNGVSDIFVFDRVTGLIERITDGDGPSHQPSISGDGQFVAFASYARHLVEGDTNNSADVFVLDRQTGRIELASRGTQGNPGNDHSLDPAISGSGQFVAFTSRATNLVAGDTNRVEDIFYYDRSAARTMRASVNLQGVGGNGPSTDAAINYAGDIIVFSSLANNLSAGDANGSADLFVHYRDFETTLRLSVAPAGTAANERSLEPALSSDGSRFAYSTFASNLIPGDSNNAFDVVVQDRVGAHRVKVEAGVPLGSFDFGNLLRLGTVQGQKYEDLDGDGEHDADEPGLDGWHFQLVDPESGRVLTSVVTGARDWNADGTIDPATERGWYSFDGLDPGEYHIREVVQPGFIQTAPGPQPLVTPAPVIRAPRVQVARVRPTLVAAPVSRGPIQPGVFTVPAVATGTPEQLPILYVHGFNDDGSSWGCNGGAFLEDLSDITGGRTPAQGTANIRTWGVQFWNQNGGDAFYDGNRFVGDGAFAVLSDTETLALPGPGITSQSNCYTGDTGDAVNPYNTTSAIDFLVENVADLLRVLPECTDNLDPSTCRIPNLDFIAELLDLADPTDYNRNGLVEHHADDIRDLLRTEFVYGELAQLGFSQANILTHSAGGLDTRAALDLMNGIWRAEAERVANVLYTAPPFGGSTLAELADVIYRDEISLLTFQDPWLQAYIANLPQQPVLLEPLRALMASAIIQAESRFGVVSDADELLEQIDQVLHVLTAVTELLFGISVGITGAGLQAMDIAGDIHGLASLLDALNFIKPIVTAVAGVPGYPKVRDDLRPFEAVNDHLLEWAPNFHTKQFVVWGEAGFDGLYSQLAPPLEVAAADLHSLHAFGNRLRSGTDFALLGIFPDDIAVSRNSAKILTTEAGGYMTALRGFREHDHFSIANEVCRKETDGGSVAETIVETLLAPVTDLKLTGSVVDHANRTYTVSPTSAFQFSAAPRTFYSTMCLGAEYQVTPASVEYRVVQPQSGAPPLYSDWIRVANHASFSRTFSSLSQSFDLRGERSFSIEWRSVNQAGGVEGTRSARFVIDSDAPTNTAKSIVGSPKASDLTGIYMRPEPQLRHLASRGRLFESATVQHPYLAQIVGQPETEWVVRLDGEKIVRIEFDEPATIEYRWDTPSLAGSFSRNTTKSAGTHRLDLRIGSRNNTSPADSAHMTYLSPGRHTLYFRARDPLGNTSAVRTLSLLVDNQGPLLGFSAEELEIVGPNTPLLFTTDDAETPVQSASLTIPGQSSPTPHGVPFILGTTKLRSQIVSGDAVRLSATATDSVGNTSHRTFGVRYDFEGPEITVEAITPGSRTASGELVTTLPRVNLQILVRDDLAGLDLGADLSWTVGSRSFPTGATLASGLFVPVPNQSGRLTASIPLTEGKNSVVIRTQDRVGNSRSTSFVIERSPARRVTASRGETVAGADFGNFRLGSVSGVVFNDLNGNGNHDAGEPGLGAHSVYLDANRDGQRQLHEPIAPSDSHGNYLFTNVGPGTYDIRPLVPAGEFVTLGGTNYIVTMASGRALSGYNFGIVQAASVSGTLFIDAGGDGTMDASDERVAGGIVWIDLNKDGRFDDGEPLASSNGNGTYTIAGVWPGDYSVRHAAPRSGHIVSTPDGGAYVVSLQSGTARTNVDFGSFQLGSINGRVFHDANRNGRRNSREPLLGGWTVYIDLNNNGSLDPGEPSAVTSESSSNLGYYEFNQVVGPGRNRLRTLPRPGWTHSTEFNDAIDVVLEQGGELISNINIGRIPSGRAAAIQSDAVPGAGGLPVLSSTASDEVLEVRRKRSRHCTKMTTPAPFFSFFSAVPGFRLLRCGFV